ncbi:MAG: hypothetical protein AAGE96_25330 [Cyanobacteria bacterium P01_G01_bin.19]
MAGRPSRSPRAIPYSPETTNGFLTLKGTALHKDTALRPKVRRIVRRLCGLAVQLVL